MQGNCCQSQYPYQLAQQQGRDTPNAMAEKLPRTRVAFACLIDATHFYTVCSLFSDLTDSVIPESDPDVAKFELPRLCRCPMCRPPMGERPKSSWLCGRLAAVFQRLRASADVFGLGLHCCASWFRRGVDGHLGITLCGWSSAA